MPNICENYIKITGAIESIIDIKNKNFDPKLLIPFPENVSDDWKYNNLGTTMIEGDQNNKDIRIEFIYEENVTINNIVYDDLQPIGIEIFFISAWQPPIPFYEKLIIFYPNINIEFEYIEYNMMICGYGNNKSILNLEYYTREELEKINNMKKWNIHIDLFTSFNL